MSFSITYYKGGKKTTPITLDSIFKDISTVRNNNEQIIADYIEPSREISNITHHCFNYGLVYRNKPLGEYYTCTSNKEIKTCSTANPTLLAINCFTYPSYDKSTISVIYKNAKLLDPYNMVGKKFKLTAIDTTLNEIEHFEGCVVITLSEHEIILSIPVSKRKNKSVYKREYGDWGAIPYNTVDTYKKRELIRVDNFQIV